MNPVAILYCQDPDTRAALGSGLKIKGFQVEQVSSEDELEDGLLRRLPHLIVLDWVHGFDGAKLKWLARLSGTRAGGVPIVLAVAPEIGNQFSSRLDLGSLQCIGKPILYQAWLARLEEILRGLELHPIYAEAPGREPFLNVSITLRGTLASVGEAELRIDSDLQEVVPGFRAEVASPLFQEIGISSPKVRVESASALSPLEWGETERSRVRRWAHRHKLKG